MKGLPIFKQTLADIYSHHFGRALDPDRNICATTGASEAILGALIAFIEPGDEVIVMEPVFEGYVQGKYFDNIANLLGTTILSNSSAASSRPLC